MSATETPATTTPPVVVSVNATTSTPVPEPTKEEATPILGLKNMVDVDENSEDHKDPIIIMATHIRAVEDRMTLGLKGLEDKLDKFLSSATKSTESTTIITPNINTQTPSTASPSPASSSTIPTSTTSVKTSTNSQFLQEVTTSELACIVDNFVFDPVTKKNLTDNPQNINTINLLRTVANCIQSRTANSEMLNQFEIQASQNSKKRKYAQEIQDVLNTPTKAVPAQQQPIETIINLNAVKKPTTTKAILSSKSATEMRKGKETADMLMDILSNGKNKVAVKVEVNSAPSPTIPKVVESAESKSPFISNAAKSIQDAAIDDMFKKPVRV